MFAVPLVTPVTTPPVTVATPGVEVDHVPVAGEPVSVTVDGIHNVVAPDGVILGNVAIDPKTFTVKPLAVAYTVCAQAAVDVCACVNNN